MMQQMDFGKFGKNLPRKNRTIASKIARRLLSMSGWRILGQLPDVPKMVIIGAPHTSNFDGVPAILALLAMDIDIRVMGKSELFAVPILAQFLRYVGVMPIDRAKKGSTLAATIDAFACHEQLIIALAPEGTRSHTDSFKSGFYYIATGAGVPIVAAALDYARKEIRFYPPFYPTGDYARDLPLIVAHFVGAVGKNPNNMAQILQDLPKR